MAKSVKTGIVLGNNGSREESELIAPLEESTFRPRLLKNVCQYCGYTSGRKSTVDKHVNSKHEMNIWFKCKYCRYASTDYTQIKLHIRCIHKFHLNSKDIRELIIDDPKEVGRLKKSQMEKRGLRSKGRQPIFRLIDKKDFKPRENPYSCQYCDYKYKNRRNAVDEHVNSVHEKTRWYQCKDCDYASLTKQGLKKHMIRSHNQYPTASSLEKLLIKDEKIVERLKYIKSKKKIQKMEIDSIPSMQEYSDFIPIDKANFKSRVNPKNCPYCSYVGKQSHHTDKHINFIHEMTKWFKCNTCKFTSLSSESLIRHLKNQHSLSIKKGDNTVQHFIVKNQQEIADLKKKRIHRKINNGKLSKMQTGMQFKDEIEIEEHSVKIEDDDNDAIIRANASMEAGLSDPNEEWLIIS